MLLIGLSAGFAVGTAVSNHSFFGSGTLMADGSARSDDTSTSLLSEASEVLCALQSERYQDLASHVDPELGVTLTPCSTVTPDTDLNFSASALKKAAKQGDTFIWGVSRGTNAPIRMSVRDYFHTYVWDADYASAGTVGIQQVLHTGDAVENVASAYPDCRYLDFYIPGTDESNQDWSALKLVFHWNGSRWYLVGIIHSGWTP